MGRGIRMSNVCAGIQLDEKSDFPSGIHLLVSQKLQQAMQLPNHSRVSLQLGQKSIPCRIQTFASTSSILRFRKDVGELLSLPDGIQLSARYEPHGRKFILGPVFGVLITKLLRTPEGIFGPASSFCQEVVQGAREKGVLAYIFTLNDIDHQNQTVNGWVWKDGNWSQQVMPMPDAVYNRLASRKHENSSDIQDLFRQWKAKGISIFNEHFLNKWQVHQALSNLAEAKPYLPTTYLYRGFATIKEVASRYPQVYLKPANGSLGIGIYRITRNGKKFTCHHSTVNGSIEKHYNRLVDLYQSVGPRISKAPYLVQQGLRLVKINGNPLDFRSLVQKDITGKWAVTSIVGRSGQDQSIVSNLARGGTIMQATKALQSASPWTSGIRPSTDHLKKVSISLAQSLESSIEGHFAELGIDLAVDTSGKVWLLEINAKPSKNDDQVLSENKTRPSVRRLLDYALFLKGMNRTKPLLSKQLPFKKKNLKRKKR